MASISKTLYVGVTSNLERRVAQYKKGPSRGFAEKYKTRKLVHYETFSNPLDAIAREKQIKGWLRKKKIALIENMNPNWTDLAWQEGSGSRDSTSPQSS